MLAQTFVEEHGLTAHVADSGWHRRSYLDLIENSGARQFWEQCIGEKKVYIRAALAALEAWLHGEVARLAAASGSLADSITQGC